MDQYIRYLQSMWLPYSRPLIQRELYSYPVLRSTVGDPISLSQVEVAISGDFGLMIDL